MHRELSIILRNKYIDHLFLLASMLAWLASSAFGAGQNSSPRPSKDPPDYSKEAYVVEQISSVETFESDGTSTAESSVRIHIQSQATLQQLGLLRLPYASATSTMALVYIRVTKPDGRVVETPADNVLEVPADITRQAPFYSDIKEKQVAVKGLEVDDRLEYEYREEVKTPLAPGQFWFAYDFFKAGVCLDEQLQVKVPRERYVNVRSAATQPLTTEEGKYRVYSWKTTHLEQQVSNQETKASGPDDVHRSDVQLTTFRSWDEVGQWFRGLASPRAAPTPEIQAKAAELTRGARSDTEKIDAIYNFVSTKFRYIGVSFGIGRYQPHAAADVLANDYGDCKDKHTLLTALLAAVGVKAEPALISSTEQIDPDVPSPRQFDHVITAIPQDKGFLFLDTTAEVGPVGYLVASLRDKKTLVIPNEGSALLVRTPADPPFKSFFTFEADGALDGEGTLTARMKMTFRGDDELGYRLALRQAGQAQWKEVMQQVSSNLGFGGTVSDVTATAPEATDTPFHIEYDYSRKDYSDWGERKIGPPFPPIFLPTVADDTEETSGPIELGSPRESVYRATIKMPANTSVFMPVPVDLDVGFAEYHASYSLSNGALQVERRLILKEREVAVGRIDTYRNFQKSVLTDVTSFISLVGPTSAPADAVPSAEARAIFEQGQQAWRQKDLRVAMDAFQRAVDRDPNFAQAWLALGAMHTMNNPDQGIREMKKGISLDPRQVPSYKYVASRLAVMHRDEDALEVWKELAKVAPEDTDAPKNIAEILLMLERYPEAVTVLEAAVEQQPKDASLRLQLGEAYFHVRQDEKGLVAIQNAVGLDHRADILNDASYSLADNNLRLDDALRYAEQAVSETEIAAGKVSLSELTLDDVQRVPTLASCWETLGWVHFRLAQYDQAEKYLQAGWMLSQNGSVADHLGQVYEKEGKKKEAAVAYLQAISAGGAPAQTRSRLNALRPGGKSQPGDEVSPEFLQSFRTVQLKDFSPKPSQHASADFFLLFGPGPKITDVRFISGSNDLRDAGKVLAAAKFNVSFPDDGPTQILRRGILDCEPEIKGCTFVMYGPKDYQSLN
jgi:tetratricopeptide (TPR) repeat protein/transglutaminase-like putative cysteine protease